MSLVVPWNSKLIFKEMKLILLVALISFACGSAELILNPPPSNASQNVALVFISRSDITERAYIRFGFFLCRFSLSLLICLYSATTLQNEVSAHLKLWVVLRSDGQNLNATLNSLKSKNGVSSIFIGGHSMDGGGLIAADVNLIF